MSAQSSSGLRSVHRQVEVEGVSIHVVQDGARDNPVAFLLHGWPQSAAAFRQVMHELKSFAHVVAIDLPGIGGSPTALPSSDARALAKCVHSVIESLGLHHVTLVGHDAGGQIVYAYLKEYPDSLERAVMMNIAIPGVDPWDEVIRNPHIWHFAFHSVPELPELLVAGHQAIYFDYFYNAIAARPDGVSADSRRAYAEAYATTAALRAGFDLYRAFAKNATDNKASRDTVVSTPVLYVRGDKEAGGIPIDRYLRGLKEAGLQNVTGQQIANCGHFTLDEQPVALSNVLRLFMGLTH